MASSQITPNQQQAQGQPAEKTGFLARWVKLEHGLIGGCVTAFVVGGLGLAVGGYYVLHLWDVF